MSDLMFPRSIDQLSIEWLSDVFGAELVSFDIQFLAGGIFADAHRLQFDWRDTAAALPLSAVLKLPTIIDANRQMALDSNVYRKEVGFFRDLADSTPVRVPEIYLVADDGSTDSEFFAILMEDLGVHSIPFDQVEDQPTEPFVRKFCDATADLHGAFWDSDILAADWISSNGRYVFPLDAVCRQCEGAADALRAGWTKHFGEEVFSIVDSPDVESLTEIITGPKSVLLLDYITDLLNRRPKTLLHGDLRADNLFRTRNAADTDAELTIIDWQLIHAGPPGPEFTQAWMHSLPVELRRQDVDMLHRYHARLIAGCPAAAAYTVDMLIQDYRLGYLLYWMMNVAGIPQLLPGLDAAPDGVRMRVLFQSAMRGMQAALADHNCLDLVQRLAAEV